VFLFADSFITGIDIKRDKEKARMYTWHPKEMYGYIRTKVRFITADYRSMRKKECEREQDAMDRIPSEGIGRIRTKQTFLQVCMPVLDTCSFIESMIFVMRLPGVFAYSRTHKRMLNKQTSFSYIT